MPSAKKTKSRLLLAATLLLAGLIFFMMLVLNQLQGCGRVINYTGLVRGGSQRLIKQELHGFADDELMVQIDEIIDGLQNGSSTLKLTILRNNNFQDCLSELEGDWHLLKQSIYDARENSSLQDHLYELSESLFSTANNAVTAAETFSDQLAALLNLLEFLSCCLIAVIFLSLSDRIMTERSHSQQLNVMAHRDVQTGLPNKLSCDEHLSCNDFLAQGEAVCCFMFDLNNLKTVNDTKGHRAGDLLISNFADLLRRAAPREMFVGRTGGDEFIGVFPGASHQDAHLLQKKLRQLTDEFNEAHFPAQAPVLYACGAACSQNYPGYSVQQLMEIADQKMYRDKTKAKQPAFSPGE